MVLLVVQNVIYLTVNLPEIKESSLELKVDAKEISFSTLAGRYVVYTWSTNDPILTYSYSYTGPMKANTSSRSPSSAKSSQTYVTLSPAS